jgi:glycosyltransferase involved in cell wall biosynthesis
MKIAFVSDAIYPYLKGGKEKRLYELSTRLARMGHDVHIYCMKWWDEPEKDRDEHGVHLHAISHLHDMYVGDRRSIKQGIMFGLACFKLIQADFDAIDVDHMPFFPIFSSWLVCKAKHRKLYGTWHEALKRSDWVNYMGLAGNVAAVIERMSIRLPYAITANSTHTLELIQTELKRTKRLHLVSPGIDMKTINKISPVDIKCDILFVGRLVKDKNVALLVEAISILKRDNSDIECFIVGTGIEEKNIAKLVTRLKLKNNVHLVSQLPRAKDIYGFMKTAKVFVLPSVREGFGIVVLEALACGTPVVTIDAPANAAKGLVLDGVNGSLVQPTVADLVTAITEWMNKVPEKKSMATLLAGYDWNALAAHQAEVYAT